MNILPYLFAYASTTKISKKYKKCAVTYVMSRGLVPYTRCVNVSPGQSPELVIRGCNTAT